MPNEVVVDEPTEPTEAEEAADTLNDEKVADEESMEPAVETEPVDESTFTSVDTNNETVTTETTTENADPSEVTSTDETTADEKGAT